MKIHPVEILAIVLFVGIILSANPGTFTFSGITGEATAQALPSGPADYTFHISLEYLLPPDSRTTGFLYTTTGPATLSTTGMPGLGVEILSYQSGGDSAGRYELRGSAAAAKYFERQGWTVATRAAEFEFGPCQKTKLAGFSGTDAFISAEGCIAPKVR